MIHLPDFPRLAALTAPHMAADAAGLPVLNGVRIEFDGTHLYAVATDRYTFAIARQEPTERAPRWLYGAFLTASDLRAIRALTPPRYKGTTDLMWAPTGRRLIVQVGEHSLTLPDRSELADKFPKWRPLAAEAIDRAPSLTTAVAVNPVYLARFTKGRSVWDYAPMTVWGHGPAKPVVVAHGTDYLGLLMPVRVEPDNAAAMQTGHDFIRAAWSDALGPNYAKVHAA